MPVLYTLLGLVLFFIIIFSIHLTLIIDYDKKILVTVKWLFLKISVFDSSKEKKPKKEKKKKEKKPEEGEKNEKPKKEKDKSGNGLLKQLYIDQGYDGLEKMLLAVGRSLSGFFGKLYKTFTIDELYITMITSSSDAADTALKYGKLCSWLYPVLGKLVSTCKVKKYDFDISPDFLAQKDEGSAYVRLHLTPIRVTNAAVVLSVQLLFKVLFKIIFSKKNSDKSKAKTQKVNNPEAVSADGDQLNTNKDGVSK